MDASPFPIDHGIYPDPEHMPPLLVALDVLVREDKAPAAFEGAVSIGVETKLPVTDGSSEAPTVVAWWHATFQKGSLDTQLTLEGPLDCTCAMILGERDAQHIVSQGTFPEQPETLEVYGDPDILKRFVNRYLRSESWLSIRGRR